jgi:hypothetical protein
VEDRISGLKDKTITCEKTENPWEKMQELTKEHTKTLQLHQNTKPANHGH